jgi:hypothetical protein
MTHILRQAETLQKRGQPRPTRQLVARHEVVGSQPSVIGDVGYATTH